MRSFPVPPPDHFVIENRTAPLPPDTTQPPVSGPSDPQTTNAYTEASSDMNRSLGLGRQIDELI